jgi:hypothetical protein
VGNSPGKRPDSFKRLSSPLQQEERPILPVYSENKKSKYKNDK